MLKKILLICGCIFIGVNFGLISGLLPIYLIIGVVLFEDGLSTSLIATSSLITAIVSGVLGYIYTYRKKRDHSEVSLPLSCFVWSFVISAVIVAVALYIYSANDIYRLG